MLRLEGGSDGVPVDLTIAELACFEGEIIELDDILLDEARRAAVLYGERYGTDVAVVDLAAVGFLQGVTFARAVANYNETIA